MKVWKKTAMFGLGLVAAVTLAACGSGGASTDSAAEDAGYVPEKLTVQFVPSQAAETLEAKAKPLEQLLSDELGIPVTVSVSTDYNTIVEAMASKQVDVGFLPPNAYVLANEQSNVKVLLQAQRYGIKQPGGESTDELVDSYRSMIVVKKRQRHQRVGRFKRQNDCHARCYFFCRLCLASSRNEKSRHRYQYGCDDCSSQRP